MLLNSLSAYRRLGKNQVFSCFLAHFFQEAILFCKCLISNNLDFKAGNQGAVVSHLKKDNHRFLVIVNQDYLDPMPLSLGWKQGRRVGEVRKDGAVQMLEGNSLQTQVGPGDALILMWEAPPKPAETP